ncbi:hypothetical protein K435DRAFT_788976 [Dendrothele bispora CBS 962.96]|uniref:Uncharacterized protein n=1 Tax=Dendrothele bispora (strain CBS 962.96) TaxID=1314807 RepID=A0A4S8MV36_DENBC|nr:hypothetical protein K435DRAFT_788976 [Dendrothele bispora CBS 962.96]
MSKISVEGPGVERDLCHFSALEFGFRSQKLTPAQGIRVRRLLTISSKSMGTAEFKLRRVSTSDQPQYLPDVRNLLKLVVGWVMTNHTATIKTISENLVLRKFLRMQKQKLAKGTSCNADAKEKISFVKRIVGLEYFDISVQWILLRCSTPIVIETTEEIGSRH